MSGLTQLSIKKLEFAPGFSYSYPIPIATDPTFFNEALSLWHKK